MMVLRTLKSIMKFAAVVVAAPALAVLMMRGSMWLGGRLVDVMAGSAQAHTSQPEYLSFLFNWAIAPNTFIYAGCVLGAYMLVNIILDLLIPDQGTVNE